MNDNQNTEITETPSETANEESISAALDTFNTNTSDDPAPAPADTAETTVGDVDDSTEDAAEAEAVVEDEDDSEDDGATGSEQQPEISAPTLPAAHIRSLQAYGWSDDEIEEAKSTPGFAAIAAKIHTQRTREIQQWANHGRQQAAQEAEQKPVSTKGSVADRLDVEALREKYGDSDLLDEIVGPINAKLDLINQLLPDLQAGQAEAQRAQLASAAAQVDGFFTSDPMKPYAEVYGTTTETLTPEQKSNRVKLLQSADYIRTGAAAQGQDIKISEAMSMAHEIVGGAFKTAAVRKELKGQVKKRANGASLRPGTQVAKTEVGPAKTQDDVVNNARIRLANLGN